MDEEILVLLSGGIDSAACVDFYLDLGRHVCGLFIDYGQKAAESEARASRAVADHYDINLAAANWRGANVKAAGFINGRNGFLIAAALMERRPTINAIALGIHAGTNYIDCSQQFVNLMQNVIDVYEKGTVHLAAPFINFNKADIYAYCKKRKVPIHLTYSCENGSDIPCGTCLSCKDREMLNDCT